ncbi:MAG: winged helix-turn-helix domain-containing protein [Steroidobacteraceae bacterium]
MASKYQVAGFTIDTALYRISSGGVAMPVEPKVFDLLVHLIRHRDRVLTREELFQQVWEGREVSDATLSNHIKSARKALGDNGDLQQTILTVRGRGYQFIGPVQEIAEGQPEPLMAQTAPVQKPRAWPLAVTVGVAVGVVSLLLLLLGWRVLVPAPAQSDAALPYILVVPFDVASEVPDAWKPFAEDVAREVSRNLRKISGLKTVPWLSVSAFKNNKAPEYIRSQLPDARYVLDAVVSISPGNTLRVAADLEDLHRRDSGQSVWSHDFKARVDGREYFDMVSEIAQAVAISLKVEILGSEQRALAEFPTNNPAAYRPYVAGWQQVEHFTQDSLLRAIDLFNQAIKLDPDFYAAYLARSDAYRNLFAYIEPPIKLLGAVKASLNDALKLRPDSAEAYSSLGVTQVMAWQWQEAWDNLNKAKALDDSLALTELGFALYYTGLGVPAKVKQALARANELDPLNSELADWGNWALFMTGEAEAARRWAEEKMLQHPDNGFVFSGAGVGAYIRGDTRRAVELAERGVELTGRAPVALIMLAQAYGYDGQKQKVLPLLAEAERANIYLCPYESAAAYLSLGEQELAIKLLYDAVDARSNCLVFLRSDPRLKPIRSDERYADLLVKVGLDDAKLATYGR